MPEDLDKMSYDLFTNKKNELLNKNFGFKSINRLVDALNNTEPGKEYAKLFKSIINRRNIFKKLNITVSDPVERKRIINIIEVVDDALDYSSDIDQLSQSDSSDYTQGKGLKILTSKQMLSRLPISLAQLKAGNNSEKLKNEIRQLLNSLCRSKKLTKQIYKSLINII